MCTSSNNSYKPITNTAWVRTQLCKLQKRCTRLAATSDKVYQLLAQGQWFSPDTPASSTTKTGCHGIAEILLKVALNTKIQIKIIFLCAFSIQGCTSPQRVLVSFRSNCSCVHDILISSRLIRPFGFSRLKRSCVHKKSGSLLNFYFFW